VSKEELLLNNINDILEGIKSMAVSANAELPAIFDEVVRWGLVSNLICLFLLIGLVLLFIVLMRLIVKIDYKTKEEFEYKLLGGTFLSLTLLAIVGISWGSLCDLALVLTSPKLYVIQYLKGLLG
jgi:hypothetical protein